MIHLHLTCSESGDGIPERACSSAYLNALYEMRYPIPAMSTFAKPLNHQKIKEDANKATHASFMTKWVSRGKDSDIQGCFYCSGQCNRS